MPGIGIRTLGVACWAMGVAAVCVAYAVPPMETLLPDTTRAFISATHPKKLSDQFNKTQLGQLVNDPVMKPFVEDLRRQFDERWSSVRERLGLRLEDLKGVASGEAALAFVQPQPKQAALAFLCDVTGHQEQAAGLIQNVSKNLTQAGAKKQLMQIQGTSLVVFHLPKSPGKDVDLPEAKAIWMHKDNLLAASDDLRLVEGFLARLAGKGTGGTLAASRAFQAVMKRCQQDAGQAVPQVRWFIQPAGYLELMQLVSKDRHRRKGRSWVDIFKSQGFTGLQGIGGYLDFGVDKYELVHRTAIYAPPPRELSMKILTFPNRKEFTPPRWVPGNVASYATFYCDVLNAFDHFGPLFDALFGADEEDKGLWEDVLKGLKDDPNGPHIDLRNELIVHLGNRISIISDYQVPITTTSERLLFAVEAKNEKAVAEAINKIFRNDKEMRRREFGGHVIWESVPEEKAAVPELRLDLPELGPEAPDRLPESHGRENALLPSAAITVACGHLLIASHYDFLEKILKPVDERETLARSVEFQMVQKTLARSAPAEKAAQTFGRTDEQARPTYELIRQGKMPESETMLGRALNTIFGAGQKGTIRKQEIDGKAMPDFEFVRRFLGPAGMHAVTEPDGWFLKGYLLPK